MDKEMIDLGNNTYAVTLYDKENEKVFMSTIEVHNTVELQLALQKLELVAYGFGEIEEYKDKSIIKI